MRVPDDSSLISPRGSAIGLLGGLVMSVCLFVPAVVAPDGSVTRPIEFPPAAWPHFMGMFATMGALLALLRDRDGAAVMALVLAILALASATGSGLFLMDRSPTFATVLCLFAGLALSALHSRPWSLGRAMWVSGLLSLTGLAYYGTLVEPAHGWWLTSGGALLLLIGGGLLECDARASAGDAGLPRAALVHRDAPPAHR